MTYLSQLLYFIQHVDAFEIIHELAESIVDIDESVIMGEIADYRTKQKIFRKAFIWSAIKHTSTTAWWTGLCGSTELSKLATRILNLPSTSAAVERSFSRHANIHSLKRNCLTTGRAAKLLYICHNLKFTEEDIDETLAMCTAAKDIGIPNQSVSQILAAASCENSSESDELVFSDSRLSTENEGHEQGVSEVRDAEKVSEVGDEELLEIVNDELDEEDEDREVDETEHSDISFDSGPSEEL